VACERQGAPPASSIPNSLHAVLESETAYPVLSEAGLYGLLRERRMSCLRNNLE